MFDVPYENLGRFAGNLATSLEAGVSTEQALSSSRRALAKTPFGGAVESALLRVRQGTPLPEALKTNAAPWPPFYIPVLEVGQHAGRLTESLRFLEHHCKMLARPARAVRNVWLYPLSIMLVGTVLRLVLILTTAPFGSFLAAAMSSARGYATLALLGILLVIPLFRTWVDPLKLAVPWLGDAERELALNRFFQVLAMMYATGGRRVESMIRFSTRCVSNLAVRRDLLQAAAGIEEGQSIPEAFAATRYVTPSEQELIAAGDLSGTLEQSFERIATETGDKLVFRMELLVQVTTKLTMLLVSYSILMAVVGIAFRIATRAGAP